MKKDLNIAGVFDIAITIEKNGAEFYRRASQHVDDDSIRKLLAELAKMEEVHRDTFYEMKEELLSSEKAMSWADPNWEVIAYFKLFASFRIFDTFQKPVEVLPDQMTTEGVLEFAIEREKEAILFYTGLMRMINEDSDAEKVNNIIFEEMEHAAILKSKLDELEILDNGKNI